MKNRNVLFAVAGAAVLGVVLISFYFSAGISGNFVDAKQTQATSQQAASQQTQVKLADSEYAPYAFLISGDTISPDTQAALAGFTLDKTALPDGSTQIVLSTSHRGYVNQTYTLKQGQQLYFIETSMGDDNDGFEGSLSDDTALVVDSQGYIVG